jgi:tRNA threonylcarbamoyladenosine biosynthesis protein TsaB
MTVVAFDTATIDTVVCAMRDGAVLHETSLGPATDGSPRHSTALLPEVENAVDAAGGWGEVERLAVGLGPGSFVGIRIALATARGLSASAAKPAVGVCTLDALGLALAEAGEGERDGLAVLDARRGEVFAALYSGEGKRTWHPFVAAPNELAERLARLSSPPLAAGAGAVRFRSELVGAGAEIPDDADPLHRVAGRFICALAEAANDVGAGPLEPIYLRPPDAERWRERDTSQRAG